MADSSGPAMLQHASSLTWDGRDWDLGGRGEGESNIHTREVGGGGEEGRGEGTRKRGGRSNAG